MKLLVVGLRRSGTTILYDALREDAALRCFYEPLREQRETPGGGSGARAEDAFAETRELRRRFREAHHPDVPLEEFNWGGPRDARLELEASLPEHVRGFLAELLAAGADVAIKETRLQHKLAAVHELAPDAHVLHLVRDPRGVTASMLLGRRRRRDLYPNADAFFTVHTRRRLWSSRPLSKPLLEAAGLPPAVPDFVRPLAVWGDAFEATAGTGERLFGERYRRLRLEDLRADPAAALGEVFAWLGRELPGSVGDWAGSHVRRRRGLEHGEDPRWARAVRLLRIEEAVEAAGYGEILALEGPDGPALDLAPPPPPSRLSAAIGRARRSFGSGRAPR